MIDPGVLLCERCGYEVRGLPITDSCPECGRTIAESSLDRRVGSAWQRRPGPISMVATAARTLTRPVGRWSEVSADAPSSSALLWVTTLAAVVVFPVTPLIVTATFRLSAAALTPIVALATWAGLLGLSWIEARGVRLIGRLRHARVTRHVAYAVVGHASAGWLAGAILAAGTTLTLAALQPRSLLLADLGIGVVVAGVVGLVWFEVLTSLGLRRMRFANHPASADQPVRAGAAGVKAGS